MVRVSLHPERTASSSVLRGDRRKAIYSSRARLGIFENLIARPFGSSRLEVIRDWDEQQLSHSRALVEP